MNWISKSFVKYSLNKTNSKIPCKGCLVDACCIDTCDYFKDWFKINKTQIPNGARKIKKYTEIYMIVSSGIYVLSICLTGKMIYEILWLITLIVIMPVSGLYINQWDFTKYINKKYKNRGINL